MLPPLLALLFLVTVAQGDGDRRPALVLYGTVALVLAGVHLLVRPALGQRSAYLVDAGVLLVAAVPLVLLLLLAALVGVPALLVASVVAPGRDELADDADRRTA